MSAVVILDGGPLGMVTNPNASQDNMRCAFWLRSLASVGVTVVIPEIADYEVRRELLRADKARGLKRLDDLKATPGVRYLPLTTATMLRAAELWAAARRQGMPTAGPDALDCDVILAAQAQLEEEQGASITIATMNVKHLSRFVHADLWQNISTSE